MVGRVDRVADRVQHASSAGLRIGYRTTGALHPTRPWLLLIQGLGFDGTGWGPVLPGLRRAFRLILMDNRGCGASDPAPRGFSVQDLAQDAVAVLDAVGVGRAHALGVSLGGMVAQELAIGHPDRVNGLVLASTTPGWPSGYPLPAPALRLMAGLQRLPPELLVRRFTENALAERTVRDDPEVLAALLAHQEQHPVDQEAWTALTAAGARYAGRGRQDRITARTLVLHGTADRVVDPRNAALLADRIPGARLITAEGLGHLFFWEDPDALVVPVVGFLRGRRGTVVPRSGSDGREGWGR
jgi:pimeloyl-ACP methyl ester carboxylesterase